MKLSVVCFTCVLFTVLLAGCSAESAAPAGGATEPSGSEPAAQQTNPAMTEKLAAADAVDGKKDKVVSKCAGCALMMNGKSDTTLEFEGYTMLFCKDACHDRFEADPEKEILALRVK